MVANNVCALARTLVTIAATFVRMVGLTTVMIPAVIAIRPTAASSSLDAPLLHLRRPRALEYALFSVFLNIFTLLEFNLS